MSDWYGVKDATCPISTKRRRGGRGGGGGLSLKGEEETLAVGTGGDRASAELGGELAEGAEGLAVAAQRGAQRLDQGRGVSD